MIHVCSSSPPTLLSKEKKGKKKTLCRNSVEPFVEKGITTSVHHRLKFYKEDDEEKKEMESKESCIKRRRGRLFNQVVGNGLPAHTE